MALKSCPNCKKIFNATVNSTKLCPECVRLEEDAFNTVRVFVKENPGAGIDETSKETGVSVNQITQYLKEGRLEAASAAMSSVIKCEKCNKRIEPGNKYCDACNSALTSAFRAAAAEAEAQAASRKEPGAKMHGRRG